MPENTEVVQTKKLTGSSAQSTNRSESVAEMLRIRIFIASPGDVIDERNLAREVIEQISGERAFRGRIYLETIAWDRPGVQIPMEAGLMPQEAIARDLPKPSECDLVIVILWSRLGTPLPAEYVKEDGTRYLSGTEWEYCDAVGSSRKTGRPRVWLYRRTEEPRLGLKDPKLDDKRAQWRLVEEFFGSLVKEDGAIEGGVNPYASPDDFRRQLEHHLRDGFTRLLQERFPDAKAAVPNDKSPALPRWTETPYPGLEAFTPEQAPIYYGRGRETDALLRILSDSQVRFIAIVGASGSGKSSLVYAGLLPRLKKGALPGSAQWLTLSFAPAQRGTDPFLALAHTFKAHLGTTGQPEREMADELRLDHGEFGGSVNLLFEGRPATAELLLVVDQFEELFTTVGKDERAGFLAFLCAAAETSRVRIVATLRADFYSRVVDSPISGLLGGQGTFPLAPPGVGALHEMITCPAQAAGLEFEEGLVDTLLAETGTDPGALSLMAFTLHELYEASKGTGKLTLAAYE